MCKITAACRGFAIRANHAERTRVPSKKIFAAFAFFAAKEVGADGCAIWYNMAMEQRDDIFDFGMMDAEDSLIDEVNPDWRDFADGGDELFWRCGCETDFVHPESLSVCPICGRERDI